MYVPFYLSTYLSIYLPISKFPYLPLDLSLICLSICLLLKSICHIQFGSKYALACIQIGFAIYSSDMHT